jgi:hypothetical protein
MGKIAHKNNKQYRGMSRREFMSSCAGCAAYASIIAMAGEGVLSFAKQQENERKIRVRLIFSHKPPDEATWPYQGYNFEGRKKQIFNQLQKAYPNMEFIPATVQEELFAGDIMETDTNMDGYLVYTMGVFTRAPHLILSYNKPTILVDDLYGGSGEFLQEYAAASRARLRVIGVSSSKFQDVIDALKCLEAMAKLKSAKLLDVAAESGYWGNPNAFKQIFGTEIINIPIQELNDRYNEVDPARAMQWAKRWIQNAEKVVEPDEQEIIRSGGMYLAMSSLLEKYKAPAFTISCLHYFYAGKLPAYPCLGFFQLNNEGRLGICEGDLSSSAMMLMIHYLTGRPGFVSDPVIDTSKNQIIYAHCVCTNKVFGPNGPSNPYHIRSHSEDRKGAAVRSLLPLGEITTSVAINMDAKELVMHQSKTVANIDEERGCRTKIAAELIGDMEKLMTQWDRFQWHRVTVFGDYRVAIQNIAALLGLKVVKES